MMFACENIKSSSSGQVMLSSQAKRLAASLGQQLAFLQESKLNVFSASQACCQACVTIDASAREVGAWQALSARQILLKSFYRQMGIHANYCHSLRCLERRNLPC